MANPSFVLAIDQGTTSSRVFLVDERGAVRGRGQHEITQHYPRPGWVEHDPEQIWDSVRASAQDALAEAAARPEQVRAVGITNQRETLVLWDRRSLRPLTRAIVWQDRRTAAECDRLKAAGGEARAHQLTGLVLDPYFTGTKLAWALAEVEGARDGAAGTVDSWLVALLSGGRAHVTDASNASRTLLCDISTGTWSPEMADLLRVPLDVLPDIVDSSGEVARTDPDAFLGIAAPIAGVAGDQQAALFGQACTAPGMAKNTYGTGSFLLTQTGAERVTSETGMLTTIAWRRDGRLSYALEGAIFVTGAALGWLRDGLGVIREAAEAGPLAQSVGDSGDVYFVPAFAGLGAPHWDPYARGTIVGITGGTTRSHLVRAAVEAMAFQSRDVADAMRDDGRQLEELRVDGGASVMDFLCQFQADLLQVPVRRPRQPETTVFGAALLAGLGAGVWTDADLAGLWRLDREFEPRISRDRADALQARWRQAVERSRGWAYG